MKQSIPKLRRGWLKRHAQVRYKFIGDDVIPVVDGIPVYINFNGEQRTSQNWTALELKPLDRKELE